MAVQQGYGKMAGANSLVFAYDTTDTTNSFKGEPTENMITGNMNTSGPASLGSDDQGDYIQLGNNTSGYAAIVVPNIYIPSGVTYTWSFELKASETFTSNFSWDTNEYSDQYPNSNDNSRVTYTHDTPTMVANEWVQYRLTVVMKDGLTNARSGDFFRFFFPTFQNKKIYYRNVQFELKDHITPYAGLGGSRSATEGLLDLTGNHTIDISNVSFNNGNIDFDGTSDFIETSLITTNSSNITSISWVYLEDWYSPNSTIGLSVDSGGPNGGYRVYNTQSSLGVWMRRSDGNGVSSISGNYRIPRKQWVQVAFVNDNGTGKIYVNDHVAISGTFTLPGLVNGPAWISRYSGGGYYLNGSVENVALYNRALSEAEIIANFNRNKKKHIGADCLLDHTTDGGGWIRFWWYTGVGWPGHETEAFGHDFGTFDSSSHYGFQKLPAGLTKDNVELLAKDNSGNIYKWDFAANNTTALRAWNSMTAGTQGSWAQEDVWNPTVLAGTFHNVGQDSWKYRVSEGVASFLLDDDGCDCYSTLNAGHAMCGGGWSQTYAQPDGAYLRYGVDLLNDNGCKGPVPERSLELFYRLK